MTRAFRIVAAVLGIVTIGFNLPFAVGALLGKADRIHRLRFVEGMLGSGVLLGVSLLACARRPEDLGPFWVAAALAALALVPAVAYALTQSELQRNGSSLDPHVEGQFRRGSA